MPEPTPKQKRDRQKRINKELEPYEMLGNMHFAMDRPVAYDRRFKTPIFEKTLPSNIGATTTRVTDTFSPSNSAITIPKGSRSFSHEKAKAQGKTMDDMVDEFGGTMKHELMHVLQNMEPHLIGPTMKKLWTNRSQGRKAVSAFPEGYNDREFEAYMLSDTGKGNEDIRKSLKLGQPNRPLNGIMDKMMELMKPSPQREAEYARDELMDTSQPGRRRIVNDIMGDRRPPE